MTFEAELQQALGAGLAPLGISVHKTRLIAAKNEACYLIFEPMQAPAGWANNRPILMRQDVRLRYYNSRHIDPEHIARMDALMRGLGYVPDGGPEPVPVLLPTDYVGQIADWTRTVAV